MGGATCMGRVPARWRCRECLTLCQGLRACRWETLPDGVGAPDGGEPRADVGADELIVAFVERGAGLLLADGTHEQLLEPGDAFVARASCLPAPARREPGDAPCARLVAVVLREDAVSSDARRVLAGFGADVSGIARALRGASWRRLGASAETTRAFRELSVSLACADVFRCRLASVAVARQVVLDAGGDLRSDGREGRIVLRACDVMRERLAEGSTIADVARACGVSVSTLRRAFVRVTGMPVHAWLTSERMRVASDLLLESDRPVGDVALAVGYANPSKFSRAFSSRVGMTPREWRRAAWNGAARDGGER